MKNLAALIPVKGFDNKSRLAEVLTQEQRRALTTWMVERAIEAAGAVSSIQTIRLIGSEKDADLKALAHTKGAKFAAEVTPELNAALQHEVEIHFKQGRPVLILFADLPWIDADAVEMLINDSLQGDAELTLAPDEGWRGTNALLYRGATPLTMMFGRNSFPRYLEQARDLNVKTTALQHPGLTRDLDTPAHWRRWQNELARLGFSLKQHNGSSVR